MITTKYLANLLREGTVYSDSEPREIGISVWATLLSALLFACLLAPHCTARFARALRSALLLAPELVGERNVFVQFSKCPESLCFDREQTLTIPFFNEPNYDLRFWGHCSWLPLALRQVICLLTQDYSRLLPPDFKERVNSIFHSQLVLAHSAQ